VKAPGFYREGKLHISSAEEAWEELRDELLPRFVLEHPGTRPWAWWRFDAPEPTRQLFGGYDAFLKSIPPLLIDEILDWGTGWYVSVGINEMADPPVVETQAGFLERHGLLTEPELDALGPDFARSEAMCAKEVT
jgi:hypothetical protein